MSIETNDLTRVGEKGSEEGLVLSIAAAKNEVDRLRSNVRNQ